MRTFFITAIIAAMAIVPLDIARGQKEMEKNVRQAYKDLLKETDKDKDGKISKTEFYAIWKDKKIADKNYKAWDTNQDGYITEDEYVKAVMDIGKKK